MPARQFASTSKAPLVPNEVAEGRTDLFRNLFPTSSVTTPHADTSMTIGMPACAQLLSF